MAFSLKKLLARIPRQTDPAPEFVTLKVTLTKDDPDPAPPTGQRRRFVLEPYYWMMEYRDAAGAVTRRRITMRTIEESDNNLYLMAFCHERNAVRSFRLDRVICLIDQDGVVEDAAPHFSELMETADVEFSDEPLFKGGRRKTEPKPNVSTYTAVRRALTPALELLIAAARSDDYLHPGEMEAILLYAEDAACKMRDDGDVEGDLDATVFEKLERTMRRMRPTREDIEFNLSILQDWDPEHLRRVARALSESVVADGRVDALEAEIIADFRSAGNIAHGLGWEDV